MKIRIGIPRALLFYHYYPLWRTFFEALGAEVVLSARTTKGILDQGIKSCVDEACLPVKLFFGHVLDLKGKADYLFIPRLVSVEKRTYICPKFLGLPDMVRHSLDDLPPVIDVTVNLSRQEKQLFQAARQAAEPLTANPWPVWRALRKALREQQRYRELLEGGLLPEEALAHLEKGKANLETGRAHPETGYAHQGTGRGGKPEGAGEANLQIALIGHPYNIYDPYISMNLVKRLRDMGATVVAPDNLAENLVNHQAGKLPKKMFWSLGKRMLGSAFHFMDRGQVDGIIHVAAFGCGPDSFTGELVERFVRRRKSIPFLSLTLDEHTGEAGVVTRLEAFLDMIRWRASANESNLSSHG